MKLKAFILIFFPLSVFSVFGQVTEISNVKSMGDYYYEQGKFDSALVYYFKELNHPETYFDHKKRLEILCDIGNSYEELANYDKALLYYKNALQLSTRSNYEKGISSSYNLLGNIYYRWGSYEKALNHYNQALKIVKSNDDKTILPSILNNIGNIYYSWKEFETSLNYYENALEIKKSNNDSIEIASYLINMGSSYLGLKDYETALDYYNQSLTIAKKNNNLQNISNCLINIGYLYHEQENYEEALNYYRQALNENEKTGSALLKAFTLKNMGETNLKTGNLDKALEYLNLSKEIGQQENLREMLSDVYFQIFQIYEKKKDFDKALEYHLLYKKVTDSLFTQNSSKRLAEIKAEYETEKKEIELRQKDTELKEKERLVENQRIVFLLGILIFIAIAGVIYLIFKNREIKKRNSLENELDKQMQLVLSAQMNPHFISNALNSIQKYFLLNDFKMANEYLADFGGLIRTILENSRKLKISVDEEIESIKLYLSLESNRLGGKFTYSIHIDEQLDVNEVMIPSLIIQPYVENAIWHGIAPLPEEEKGKIDIYFLGEGKNLKCVIEDNGIGINESKKLKLSNTMIRKSLGIEINNTRIELLNKTKKTKMQVLIQDRSEIDEKQRGTIVTFKIPQE